MTQIREMSAEKKTKETGTASLFSTTKTSTRLTTSTTAPRAASRRTCCSSRPSRGGGGGVRSGRSLIAAAPVPRRPEGG
jgi:hypothetical protein